MIERAVVVFPQFGKYSNFIQDIRDRYDPLANKIAPHITLVFPKELSNFDRKLKTKVDKITTEIILEDLSSEVEFEIKLKR